MKTLLHIMYTELKRVLTTPSILSVMVVAIFLYFVLYPQPYLNEAIRNVSIAVIDQDKSVSSRKFIRDLNATDGIHISSYFSNLAEAEQYLKERKVYGIITIPYRFEQKILAGSASPVSFYADASYVLIYSTVATAINSVALTTGATISGQRQIAQGVDSALVHLGSSPFSAEMIPLFNPQAGYATYVIPPAFILILHQTLLLGALIAGFNGRHSRLEQDLILQQPSKISVSLLLIIGKSLSYLLIYSFNFAIYTLFAPYWFDLPSQGDFFSSFLFSVPFILSVSLMGICGSFFVKRIDSIFMLVLPPSIIVFFMSGMSWPKEMIPTFLTIIGDAIPATAAIIGSVRMNQMGASLAETSQPFLHLWLLVLAYGLCALWLQSRYITQYRQRLR